MDYHVAYDTPKNTMRETWLTAAGLNSIPATFLLDDAGTILWIGHPDYLEKQLEVAFAGKTDVVANRAAFVTASNWLEGSSAAIAKADAAYRAGRKDEAEKTWSETVATWPRTEFSVLKARMEIYSVGSPESLKVINQLLAGGSLGRETAMKFAMGWPLSERAEAETVVDRGLDGKPDDHTLCVAAVAYNRLGAYPKAIKAAEAAIAQVDERLADPKWASFKKLLEQNRTAYVKIREEAVAKSSP